MWNNDIPVLPDSILEQVQEDSILISEEPKPEVETTIVKEETAVEQNSSIGSFLGVVLSGDQQKPLKSATVVLTRDSVQTSVKTDEDGLFTISIEPGVYSIKVYKKGYSFYEKTSHNIAGGKNSFLEILLEKKILKGQLIEIKPTASSSSQSLLDKRRQGGVVIEGMGADQISKSTDSDAGAIAKRVTGTSVVGGKYIYVRGLGERYTNMTLNGLPVPSPEKNKRVVPQDLFPASALESFSIYKTFNPDLNADFGGGSVALITKGIPDEDFLKLSVGTGNKDYTGDGQFTILGKKRYTYENGSALTNYFGFDDGTRQVPDGIPRAITVSQFSETERADFARQFNNTFSVDTGAILPDQSYSLSMGKLFDVGEDKKSGVLFSVGFKNKYDQLDLQKTKVSSGALRVMDSVYNPILDTMLLTSVLKYDTILVWNPRQREYVKTPVLLEVIKPGIDQSLIKGKYSSTISGIGNWGYESKDHQLWLKTFYANLAEDQTTYNFSTEIQGGDISQGNDVEERYELEFTRRDLMSGQFGGAHYLGTSVLDSLSWAGGGAFTSGETPDHRLYRYWRESEYVDITQDTVINGKRYREGDTYLSIDSSLFYNNVAQYGTRSFEELMEWSTAGRLDMYLIVPPSVTVRDTFLTEPGWFSHLALPKAQTGTFFNFKSRSFSVARYGWQSREKLEDPTGSYDFIENIRHPDSVYNNILDTTGNSTEDLLTKPNENDSYLAREFNYSNYLNTQYAWRFWGVPTQLHLGGRHELYILDLDAPFTGEEVYSNPDLADDTAAGAVFIELIENHFYPSTGIDFEFFKNFKTRLLYSQTLVKPSIRERSPYRSFEFEEGLFFQGNPALKNTTIQNYDLRFDWFFPYQQLFSLSGFYKDFDKPIETTLIDDRNQTWINAQSAWLIGVESEFNMNISAGLKKLGWEHPLLQGLSLYANAAFIKSKVKIPNIVDSRGISVTGELTSKSRPMVGQSPYLYNFKLRHETKLHKFEFLNVLLFNVSGERIDKIGVDGDPDIYEQPFPSLDYLQKISLGRGELKLQIKNLLNASKKKVGYEHNANLSYEIFSDEEISRFYADSPEKFLISKENVGISFSLGYSYKF